MKINITSLLCLAVVAMFALPANAAVDTHTWTGGGSSGNWSDAANWGGAAPSNLDNLVFPAGAARKANNNNSLTNVSAVNFYEGGYTISGSGVGTNLALNGNIGNTGYNTWSIGLTLGGPRTITSIPGTTGGTLTLNGKIALGSSGSVIFDASHGTGNDGDITVAGIISGTGTGVVVTKAGSGSGTVTLSGVNTYEGKTAINNGFLSVSSDSNLGKVPTSVVANKIQFGGGYLRATTSFTLNSKRGATITAAGATTGFWADTGATLTYGGIIAEAGSLSYNLSLDGEGTIALSGASTYGGKTIVMVATARISNSAAFGMSALDGGERVEVTALSTVELTGGITVPKAMILDYATLLSSSSINGWSGTITIGKNTSGKSVIRSDADSTLALSKVIISTDYITEPINTFQNLYIEGAGDISIAGQISGDGTDGAGGYLLGHGDVVMDGTGKLTLSGKNIYSGRTIVNSGVVAVSADSNLGAVPGTATAGRIVINDGATLEAYGDFTLSETRGIALGPTAGSGSGTVQIDSACTVQYAGIIANNSDDKGSGVGGLMKTGAGVLLLAGANTYSEKTVIAAGTLGATSIKGDGSVEPSSFGIPSTGNGTIQMGTEGDATLLYSGTGDTTDRVIDFGGSGNSTLTQNGSGLLKFTSDFTVSVDAHHILTLNGSGTGEIESVIPNGDTETTELVKGGEGAWILTRSNTFSGPTTITAGTLQIGNGGTTGSLNPASDIQDDGTLTFYRTDTLTQGTDFAGIISGAGAVNQNGSGTVEFTGANAYTGPTAVNAGKLLVNGSIAAESTVAVNSTGTLGGTGTVNGTVTVASGGTVAPGVTTSSVGTLKIGGDTTFEAGSTYKVDVSPSPNGNVCDKMDLSLTGNLALGDGVSILDIGTLSGDGCTIAINVKDAGVSGYFRDTAGNILEDNSQLHIGGVNTNYYIHYVNKPTGGYIVLNLHPTSAGSVILAYDTPNGVVIEFQTIEEAGMNDIVLNLFRAGQWVEVGRQPSTGEGNHTYRFLVPGVKAGDIINLQIRDDEGKTHDASGLLVSEFKALSAQISQANSSGMTLQWESTPGRLYDVYRATQLGGIWEYIQTVEATKAQTSLFLPAAPAQTTGFFRIGVR